MSRKSPAKLAIERQAILTDDQIHALVFAEVVAWQDERGGGQDELFHANRITAAIAGQARTGLTKASRYQLITRAVTRMMTEHAEATSPAAQAQALAGLATEAAQVAAHYGANASAPRTSKTQGERIQP